MVDGGGLSGLVASPMRPASGGAGVLTAYCTAALPDAEGRRLLDLLAAAAGAALDDVRGTVPERASAPARAARAIAVEDDAAEAEGWVVLGELAAEWQVDVPAAAARVLAAG